MSPGKKSRLQDKDVKLPDPAESKPTEWSGAYILSKWLDEIISSNQLELGPAEVERKLVSGQRPDITIFRDNAKNKAFLIIEAKLPEMDPFNVVLAKEAFQKAKDLEAPFFATTNFQKIVVWNTESFDKENVSEEEKIVIVKDLAGSDFESLELLDNEPFRTRTKGALSAILHTLLEIHKGKRSISKKPIDEHLIHRLRQKVDVLSRIFYDVIYDAYHKDDEVKRQITNWFREQLWNFTGSVNDIMRASRQAAYMFINKILFHDVLQKTRPAILSQLILHEHIRHTETLYKIIYAYFEEVLRIDYESVFTTDIIERIVFLKASKEQQQGLINEIIDIAKLFEPYDFSNIGLEIIGRVFEMLIPPEHRRNYGQYFTPTDVVDFILGFAITHEDDYILDPGCGAGTFLVRSYWKKRLMNQLLKHEDILQTLWGIDIARFPAHLATINLAIQDLSSEENYPNIIQADFFTIKGSKNGFNPEKWINRRALTLGKEEKEIRVPAQFDAIVGNPPYTRQEDIDKIMPGSTEYKENLINNALTDISGKKIADIDKRAGIYAYFIVHSWKFLKEEGKLAMIVSNTWLDTDFGKGLKQFLLTHFDILAIIDSAVERFFAEADINTCIIFLRKNSDEKQRSNNIVRFVRLKKPLQELIKPQGTTNKEHIERKNSIEQLVDTILAHQKDYENKEFRIKAIKQKNLKPEEKWGQILRSAGIIDKVFKLVKKSKLFVPFSELADIKRGFTSGADPWFYVKDVTNELDKEKKEDIKRRFGIKKLSRKYRIIESGDKSKWVIEAKYLKPILTNPSHFRAPLIDVSQVKDRVVLISRKPSTEDLINRYILYGERTRFQMGKDRSMIPAKTKTCSSREIWYILPNIEPAQLFWQKAIYETFRHFYTEEPVLANQRFYPIYPHDDSLKEVIAGIINSTYMILWIETQRSALGMGALEATVKEVKQWRIPDLRKVGEDKLNVIRKAFEGLKSRPIGTLEEELGANEPEQITKNTVQPDRFALDKVIFQDILGLTEEEHIELYRELLSMYLYRKRKATEGVRKGSLNVDTNDLVDKIINGDGREE